MAQRIEHSEDAVPSPKSGSKPFECLCRLNFQIWRSDREQLQNVGDKPHHWADLCENKSQKPSNVDSYQED